MVIDGKLSVTKKENIEGEHGFSMKCDRIFRDTEGIINLLYLKLTEAESKFQVKIEYNRRGYARLEKLVIEEYLERNAEKIKESLNHEFVIDETTCECGCKTLDCYSLDEEKHHCPDCGTVWEIKVRKVVK